MMDGSESGELAEESAAEGARPLGEAATRKPKAGCLLPLLLLAGAVFLGAKGVELVLVQSTGVATKGTIRHVAEEQNRHGRSYTYYYDFKTHDRSVYSGSASGARPLRPFATVPIRYLALWPDLNQMEMTTSAAALMLLLYGIPALLLLGFALARLARGGLDAEAEGCGARLGGAALACLLGLLAYGLAIPHVLDGLYGSPVQTTPIPPEGAPGNTPGNLQNDGLFAEAGPWVVYVNRATSANDGGWDLWRARPDGAEAERIAPGPAHALNVLGERVYYLRWEAQQGDRIHAAPVAGGAARRLRDEAVGELCAQGDWLYYTLEHQDHNIFRCRLDGSGQERLNRDQAKSLSVIGSWIYYVNESDRKQVYRMRTNGAERTCLGAPGTVEMGVAGERILLRTRQEAEAVMAIPTAGGQPSRLLDLEVRWINTHGAWLYFSHVAEDGALCRAPLPTGNGVIPMDSIQILSPTAAQYIHLLPGGIYFGTGDILNVRLQHLPAAPNATVRPFPTP